MNYIVANWKCNPKTVSEAKKILAGYAKIKKSSKVQAIVCPPVCYLGLVKDALKSNILIGGQNCFCQDGGAFTGEISASQLASIGAKYVIIGHSERRQNFGETNEFINKKIKMVVASGLTPILCVGENREQRIEGKITDVVEMQIKECLQDIDLINSKIIIAYEPVWAIGTGEACSSQEAGVVRQFIINKFTDKIPVIYGGSVNSQNCGAYINEAGFNGLLVGAASLDSKEFLAIISVAKE